MAIIKDKKHDVYYINYKIKTPNGWKNINIRNHNWKMSGTNKVGIRYMQSIQFEEIEKDKRKRKYSYKDGETLTVEKLCEAFYAVSKSDGLDEETIYNYKLAFKNYLFPVIGEDKPVNEAFKMVFIDKFKVNLTSKGLKTHTINNKMVCLKNLLKFAKKRKFISREMADDAIDLLEPIRENKRACDTQNFFINGEEDVRKFINSFDNEDAEWRIPILTLFYGAFRIGEWQAIQKKNVDFDNDCILVCQQIDNHGDLKTHTKTGEDRLVHLPHTFMQELKEYVDLCNLNDNEYIFRGSRCDHIGRNFTRNLVNKHLELAGIEHITLHGLRHSFATRMFDKGYDVKEVQAHLGHASMETTMKYYIHYTQRKEKKDLDDLL